MPVRVVNEKDGLWVQYYRKKSTEWTLEEQEYFVLMSDIVSLLSPPASKLSGGSRMTYVF